MKNSKKIIVATALLLLSTMGFSSESLGKTVYQHACIHCHGPNVARGMNAPMAFDKKAWQKRMNHAEQYSGPGKKFKNAYNYLLHQVKVGRGLMHHHGLCLESQLPKSYCSDNAYIAAIHYMAGLNK